MVSNKFKGKKDTSNIQKEKHQLQRDRRIENVDVFKSAEQVSLFMCVVVFGCLPMALNS